MLAVAVGHSADIDLEPAVETVLAQVSAALGSERPSAGLLFIADGLDHRMIVSRIRAALPGVPLIGCTTAGEASTIEGFQDDSILLVLFRSPDIRFAVAVGRAPSVDPDRAVEEAHAAIAGQLGGTPPELCFMLSDTVDGDPDLALRALSKRFEGKLPIVGGAAASFPPWSRTSIFFEDEILSDAFVLLALTGPLQLATATENSWRPVGTPGRVTAADGPTILRIDDRPALDFYRRMLGEDVRVFLGPPLAILDQDGRFTVRTPIAYDDDERTITLVGGISEGDRVQLAFATVEDVERGAGALIERTLSAFPDATSPAVVFFCSCAVRRMFLAQDVQQEFQQLRKRLGPAVPVVGFYGYGEIGSNEPGSTASFYNQAIVSVALK